MTSTIIAEKAWVSDPNEWSGVSLRVMDYGVTEIYAWDEQGNNVEYSVPTTELLKFFYHEVPADDL